MYGDEHPLAFQEHQLHSQRMTVWCVMWVGGIAKPYTFENDEGATLTSDGNRYRAMLTDFV